MIDWIHSPWDMILAGLFLLLGLIIVFKRVRKFKGVGMVQESISQQRSVDRDIFGTVIAGALFCFSIALFFKINWIVWLGLGFIAEELFQLLLGVIYYMKRDKR